MTLNALHAPAPVLLVTLVAVGLSAGLLLGVVPWIIVQAYRGESLPVLNAMIRGQAAVPVDHYLSIWRALAMRILGGRPPSVSCSFCCPFPLFSTSSTAGRGRPLPSPGCHRAR